MKEKTISFERTFEHIIDEDMNRSILFYYDMNKKKLQTPLKKQLL